ncbi:MULTISPECIES: hypothetical protein [Burkholderia cepacia complex]|uniref:hypothetical protein n=1 Tax=Burkholderia cepacia complex TaxID=87882 RepID=UPI0026556697|nr:hypothetical protein [Burkholderia seminalis]MDN7586089.1 hypothetical protein [Burkholderia seminalis]
MNEVDLLLNMGLAPHAPVVNAVPELLPPPKAVPTRDDPDGEHKPSIPLPFAA